MLEEQLITPTSLAFKKLSEMLGGDSQSLRHEPYGTRLRHFHQEMALSEVELPLCRSRPRLLFLPKARAGFVGQTRRSLLGSASDLHAIAVALVLNSPLQSSFNRWHVNNDNISGMTEARVCFWAKRIVQWHGLLVK